MHSKPRLASLNIACLIFKDTRRARKGEGSETWFAGRGDGWFRRRRFSTAVGTQRRPRRSEPWADQDVGGGLILEESESPLLKDWVTETKETPCNFASYGNLLDHCCFA
jgi:hypothetical protein